MQHVCSQMEVEVQYGRMADHILTMFEVCEVVYFQQVYTCTLVENTQHCAQCCPVLRGKTSGFHVASAKLCKEL